MLDRTELVNFIVTNLGVDEDAIADETPLLSSGLVDSFGMVELLVFVEGQTGASIDPGEVNLENFDSVQRILGFTSELG
jgi:acyl carrier protein